MSACSGALTQVALIAALVTTARAHAGPHLVGGGGGCSCMLLIII